MLLNDISDLAERARVGDLLNAAELPCGGNERLLLGLIVKGRRFYAAAGGVDRSVEEGRDRILLGCLMKVFTATLVALMAQETVGYWTDEDVEHALFPQRRRERSALRSIKLKHLLNHTHGLDDSLIRSVPRLADGAVDPLKLCNALNSTPPLAPPGKFYTYGNAGAWLSGAILERRTCRSYRDLIFEKLIGPLRLTSAREHESMSICPAWGDRFTLSLADVMTFLNVHLLDSTTEGPGPAMRLGLRLLRANPVALPGWGLGERGVCQGWKYYGSGWYGHDARMPEYSALLRIHPETAVGIVFSGTGKHSFSAFSRIFARTLPEFADIKLPGVLDRSTLQNTDLAPFAGVYRIGAMEIRVALATDHTLHYQICEHVMECEPINHDPVSLVAASQNIFFARRKPDARLPFLQFLDPGPDGLCEYLWNGRCLWRRRAELTSH